MLFTILALFVTFLSLIFFSKTKRYLESDVNGTSNICAHGCFKQKNSKRKNPARACRCTGRIQSKRYWGASFLSEICIELSRT